MAAVKPPQPHQDYPRRLTFAENVLTQTHIRQASEDYDTMHCIREHSGTFSDSDRCRQSVSTRKCHAVQLRCDPIRGASEKKPETSQTMRHNLIGRDPTETHRVAWADMVDLVLTDDLTELSNASDTENLSERHAPATNKRDHLQAENTNAPNGCGPAAPAPEEAVTHRDPRGSIATDASEHQETRRQAENNEWYTKEEGEYCYKPQRHHFWQRIRQGETQQEDTTYIIIKEILRCNETIIHEELGKQRGRTIINSVFTKIFFDYINQQDRVEKTPRDHSLLVANWKRVAALRDEEFPHSRNRTLDSLQLNKVRKLYEKRNMRWTLKQTEEMKTLRECSEHKKNQYVKSCVNASLHQTLGHPFIATALWEKPVPKLQQTQYYHDSPAQQRRAVRHVYQWLHNTACKRSADEQEREYDKDNRRSDATRIPKRHVAVAQPRTKKANYWVAKRNQQHDVVTSA